MDPRFELERRVFAFDEDASDADIMHDYALMHECVDCTKPLSKNLLWGDAEIDVYIAVHAALLHMIIGAALLA